MFRVRLSCPRVRRRGSRRTYCRPNHILRQLQGTLRRGDRIRGIAKWKRSKDRTQLCRFIKPIAATRRAKVDQAEISLSRLTIALCSCVETAGQMSEMWNVPGLQREALSNLGLSCLRNNDPQSFPHDEWFVPHARLVGWKAMRLLALAACFPETWPQ